MAAYMCENTTDTNTSPMASIDSEAKESSTLCISINLFNSLSDDIKLHNEILKKCTKCYFLFNQVNIIFWQKLIFKMN